MIQIMISGQANFKPFFIIQIIVEIIISEQVVLLQKSMWQQLALKKCGGNDAGNKDLDWTNDLKKHTAHLNFMYMLTLFFYCLVAKPKL